MSCTTTISDLSAEFDALLAGTTPAAAPTFDVVAEFTALLAEAGTTGPAYAAPYRIRCTRTGVAFPAYEAEAARAAAQAWNERAASARWVVVLG